MFKSITPQSHSPLLPEIWSKHLFDHATKPLWFARFLSPAPKLSWYQRTLNHIRSKWDDIKCAYRIVFKGEYPD